MGCQGFGEFASVAFCKFDKVSQGMHPYEFFSIQHFCFEISETQCKDHISSVYKIYCRKKYHSHIVLIADASLFVI